MPARVEALRRPQILTACLFLTHALGVTRAWSLSRPPPCARAATNTPNAPTELRRVAALAACAAEHAHAGGGEAVPDERSEREAVELLDVLEVWLRRQKVSSVLSREQATALLEDLRNDKRFWAQQRRQFSRVWTAIVEGLSQEERPLSAVLGPDTSSRLLDALEEMDDEAMNGGSLGRCAGTATTSKRIARRPKTTPHAPPAPTASTRRARPTTTWEEFGPTLQTLGTCCTK